MDFLWPGLLVLLGLLPILVAVYAWSLRRRRPSGVRYSSLALVREALPGSSRLRRHLPFALFVLAVGALVVALARPVLIVSVPANQTSIILAIDVSGSMCSADIPPSRLQAAEAAAASFIEQPGIDDPDRDRRLQRLRRGGPGADDRRRDAARRAPQPRHGPPDGHRQRHPRLDRRDRGDRPGGGAQPDRLAARLFRPRRCPRAPTPRTSSWCSPTA